MIGTFEARAISSAIGKSGTGNYQLVIIWRVTEEGPAHKRTFTSYLSLTEAAAPHTIDKLRIAGWQRDALAEFDNADEQALSTLLPNAVLLVLDDVEGVDKNGAPKMYTEIKYINKISIAKAKAKNEISRGELLSLNESMMSLVRGIAKQSVQAPPKTKPAVASGNDWDGTGPDPADEFERV
jgi:hypothetical protein